MFFEIICNTYFLKFLFCWTVFPEFRSGVGLVRGQPSDSVKKLFFFFVLKYFSQYYGTKKCQALRSCNDIAKFIHPHPPPTPIPNPYKYIFVVAAFLRCLFFFAFCLKSMIYWIYVCEIRYALNEYRVLQEEINFWNIKLFLLYFLLIPYFYCNNIVVLK